MTDDRKPLTAGTVLSFPGMNCTITEETGHGSNAFAYYGYYPDDQYPDLKHQVLIKELFPYLPEGAISRNDDNTLSIQPSDAYKLHRMSFERAVSVHMKLQESHPEQRNLNPDYNINTFALNNTLYSVLSFSGGRTLDHEGSTRRLALCSLKDHVQRILKLLDVLESFHLSGLLHLDISPDNILLTGSGHREMVSLIDYNSVHTISELNSDGMIYFSFKHGYTAPEVLQNRAFQIGYASDLYSVAAVFYWMLSEKTLTEFEFFMNRVPELSDISCLKKQPESVKSLVYHILKRGLYSRVSRRYQDTGQMRADFQELLDRIDGIGITHAALWEYASVNTRRIIRSNTAYAHLLDEDAFYPLEVCDAEGNRTSLSAWITSMTDSCGSPVFLSGKGGAGKTSALLKMASSQKKCYRQTDPVFLYLSLYCAHTENPDFLQNSILQHLNFHVENQELSDYHEIAVQKLMRLLSEPIRTKTGTRPKLIMLLDGLNEAAGDTAPLLQEIRQWSDLEGVRLILTGRTDISLSGCMHHVLCPLEDSCLTTHLTKAGFHGTLSPDMLALLRTPLMLSICLQTLSYGDRISEITDPDQLLERYLNALLQKAKEKNIEDSNQCWQNTAAVSYVLPAIAAAVKKEGHALSDEKLLPVIEALYNRVKTRAFQNIFPEWIGHSEAILGDADNADAWYGMMVHQILWHDLGLLIRNEEAEYRVFHQFAEEYLVKNASDFQKKFARIEFHQKLRKTMAIGIFLCAIIAGTGALITHFSTKKTYNANLMENVLDRSVSAYETGNTQYEDFTEFLDAAASDTPGASINYIEALKKESDYVYEPESAADDDPDDSESSALIESLLDSGEVSFWSEQAFDSAIYDYVMEYPEQQEKRYELFTAAIIRIRQDESLISRYPDYIDDVEEYLSMDRLLLASYYKLLIQPELEGMRANDPDKAKTYYSVLTPVSQDVLDELPDEVADLRIQADDYRHNRDNYYSYSLAYMRNIVKNEAAAYDSD